MALARHGTGLEATGRAFWSQVHPVFMLPPLAASLFGAVLATGTDPVAATVHVVAMFAAVYTAHVKDGYVDFHLRGEDDDHPLTVAGCRLGLVASSSLFALCCVVLFVVVDWVAVVLTLPTWLIAYHHAPQLDMHPISATMGYPAGIALSILGGFYVQAMALEAVPVAFAVVFLLVLSGIKVIDDTKDFDYDRSIGKRTVAVVIGRERAYTAAYGLMIAGLTVVIALVALGTFPVGAVLAVVAFAVIGVIAARAEPTLATMLLIRGCYVFLALLVAAVWFRPLEGLV